jgi:hypothetical protein
MFRNFRGHEPNIKPMLENRGLMADTRVEGKK